MFSLDTSCCRYPKFRSVRMQRTKPIPVEALDSVMPGLGQRRQGASEVKIRNHGAIDFSVLLLCTNVSQLSHVLFQFIPCEVDCARRAGCSRFATESSMNSECIPNRTMAVSHAQCFTAIPAGWAHGWHGWRHGRLHGWLRRRRSRRSRSNPTPAGEDLDIFGLGLPP